MPLSEFLRMSKRKHESDQQMSATHLTDPSSIPENDFVELVWDNGQLTMQGQSSRAQKSDNQNNIPSHMHKHRAKYFENPNSSRKLKIGSVESFQDEGLPAVPSIDTDSNQHNGLVPWLNYQAEEFLPEASDVTVNEKANHNSLSSNKSSFNQTFGHLHKFFAADTQKSKPDLARPGSGSSLPNFPFISRYTSLQKANTAELMASNLQKERPSGSQPCEKPYLEKKSYELSQEDQEKDDISLHQVAGLDSNKRVSNEVKAAEPVVAASSVCSGSSGDRASSDQPQLKRKCHDIDESEYRSEDVEEESVGIRKAAPTRGGAGSKRSRAAEVHNLSERRRRDRINEKMRALQELIPNCNKTDKASMLDEAIEYLKTLQLQVQVMSMGSGLWMPPMMFPAGMQHMNNYSPLGIGVGFGMNMLDMNGGFPMFPAQQMQHPHFPSPSLSRPAKFPGMAGPNVPVLGHPMPVPRAPVVPFSTHTSTNSSTPSLENPAGDKNAQPIHDADVNLANGNIVKEKGGEI